MFDIRLKKRWLDIVREMFAIVDASILHAIQTKKQPTACLKGCSFCCHHKIPLTLIEVLAIKEYVRANGISLLPHGSTEQEGDSCPFLADGSCSIYSVRPIACRRYMMFNKQCEWNEDPFTTRPGDVLEPSRKALVHALELTRPFYEEHGLWPAGETTSAPFFTTFCTEIRAVDWGS